MNLTTNCCMTYENVRLPWHRKNKPNFEPTASAGSFSVKGQESAIFLDTFCLFSANYRVKAYHRWLSMPDKVCK